MYECDGRTDGHRMTAKAVLCLMLASRGKNRRIGQEHRLNLSEFNGNMGDVTTCKFVGDASLNNGSFMYCVIY